MFICARASQTRTCAVHYRLLCVIGCGWRPSTSLGMTGCELRVPATCYLFTNSYFFILTSNVLGLMPNISAALTRSRRASSRMLCRYLRSKRSRACRRLYGCAASVLETWSPVVSVDLKVLSAGCIIIDSFEVKGFCTFPRDGCHLSGTMNSSALYI